MAKNTHSPTLKGVFRALIESLTLGSNLYRNSIDLVVPSHSDSTRDLATVLLPLAFSLHKIAHVRVPYFVHSSDNIPEHGGCISLGRPRVLLHSNAMNSTITSCFRFCLIFLSYRKNLFRALIYRDGGHQNGT
ncbi:hypothetical protein OPQ81_007371 [Rhizoctonia solani]|nr:hypothetical protein OPQ81_007371 [Rhizoctonia solani]